jgi:hypothetical protein
MQDDYFKITIMKKFTLLFTLLITSLVFSQQVVIENFDTTPAAYTFVGFEKLGSASIATDPAVNGTKGNNLKMVSSSTGNPWQGAEIILSGRKKIILPLTQEMSGGFRLNSDGWTVFVNRGFLNNEEHKEEESLRNSISDVEVYLESDISFELEDDSSEGSFRSSVSSWRSS